MKKINQSQLDVSMYDKLYAIDTNIILNDYTNIFKLSQNGNNLIFIPETVLDEIDSKKSGFEDINFQARSFARLLSDLTIKTEENLGSVKLIYGKVQDVSIAIISKEVYDVKKNDTSSNIYNDRKIIEVIKDCIFFTDFKRLKFITLDSMAKIRAYSVGIQTENLKLDNQNDEIDFFRSIQVDTLPNIVSEIPDHKPENFAYEFILPDGHPSYAIIQHQNVVYIDESLYNTQIIKPRNKEQKFFSSGILSPFYNIVMTNALAGSGKTLLALSGSISLVKNKNTNFSSIIYVRNSIESLDKGEDIGYLPGLEEKFKVYNHPLYDCLDAISQTDISHSNNNRPKATEIAISKEAVRERSEELIKRCNIETLWIGEARGRTFSNTVMIIDEAQNMSKKSLLTILTRLDSTCKVIIIGSNNQIDNMYINKHINGLTSVLNCTKTKEDSINMFAIKLNKVLRGPITEWAERVLSN